MQLTRCYNLDDTFLTILSKWSHPDAVLLSVCRQHIFVGMEACGRVHVDGSMGMGGCGQEGMERSMRMRTCGREQFFDNLFSKNMIFWWDLIFHIGMKRWGEEWLIVLLSVYRLHIFAGLEASGQIPHKQIVACRKFWKEGNVVMVDPNATSQYPMTIYSCYHPTTTISTGKKNCSDATILTLPSWCFLPKAILQILLSKC